ncbi:(deoxy)nucleoside triphosphate pyrophosphohydrolase [Mucilaginibacter aquaedulcis]|uniref:(deoxy)nucleoside triphosphate pyrophosphohydrolase n=1 Tax=Mucilaginibacter aquaedulcis TaxID=1187081 RepID=UPI0025B45D1C|nr:(deoxy)nucleoside triphosphate pyrophosphohydrolase [Mucilaginibacter aquaedulcis]MDN3550750.1 (deoxy)nucleoside triphosphate pyrophosphohydrolase [Mucilaginibacter aquaedulcis]
MIQVTCAIIIDSQERVLVTQRSKSMSLPLKWEFPGGKVEPDETPEACLIREIKEELDIEIQIKKALLNNIHIYPNITIQLIPFTCKHISGDILLKEHAEFKWLHGNELLALDWADADVPIVNYYLTNRWK